MIKKLLIVTYYFPPRESVASQRLGGLAKYLPEFGWNPTIITPTLPESPDPRFHVIETEDSDLLLEWKKRLGFSADKTFREQLGKTKKNDTAVDGLLHIAKEILAYPDYNKKWYNYVMPVAREALKTGEYDAIQSSAGPYTSHIIAHDLKKEFGTPWIADFRDLWTQNHSFAYSRFRKHFEANLEIRTLANADAITTVSDPLAVKLRELHKTLVHVVPNGFDPDLLNYSQRVTEKFSINYTGRIYRGKMDPEPLFKVIRKILDEKKIPESELEINFWGCKEGWIQKIIDENDLTMVVTLHNRVPHSQSLEIQRNSQILLLFIWNDPEEEGIVTGKLYEYLVARRPILAWGLIGGTIPKMLDDTKAGCVAETEVEIERALIRYYHQYIESRQVLYSGVEKRIMQYSHREMARKYSYILNSIVKT